MIPYFQFISLQIGPVTIYVWGLMVAIGILLAALLAKHLAERYVLSSALALDCVLWAILGGLVGARIFHVIFYAPVLYLNNPIEVFYIWRGGLSSLGGFVGACFAVWLFLKVRRISYQEFLPYLDILTVSLWLGWGVGRIGCFLIHDHPGTLTHFIAAVKYPGGARHDLGFYESILGFVLFIISWFLLKRLPKKQWGLVAAVSWLLYAAARFGLDFLRATDLPSSDARYANLTPAQWGMAALFFTLTGVLIYGRVSQNKSKNIGRVA